MHYTVLRKLFRGNNVPGCKLGLQYISSRFLPVVISPINSLPLNLGCHRPCCLMVRQLRVWYAKHIGPDSAMQAEVICLF